MRSFKIIIGILSLWIFSVSLNAKSFVLDNQGILVEKTTDFMEILSLEVYEKSGVRMYVVALEDLGNMSLQEREQTYTKGLKEPYLVLFFVKNNKKIDIITSKSVETMFDKRAVYWDYIVPLIPLKDEELTQQNISAFLLNGFVDIADRIAEFHKIELEHNFPKQNKGVQIATRMTLYVMMFVLLVLFLFVYLRRK